MRLHWLAAPLLVAAVAAGVVAPATAASDAQGHQRPHRVALVTVVDRTAGRWPLADVVTAWSRSRYVDAKLAPRCLPWTYCVIVRAGYYGDTGWAGLTIYRTTLRAAVKLNLTAWGDARQRSAVWCHEMGHTLGIAHPAPTANRPGVHGCIASTDATLITPLPSRADLAQLRAIRVGTPQGKPALWGALWVIDYVGRWRS